MSMAPIRQARFEIPLVRAEIDIPLVVGERLMGVFSAMSETPNRFTREDARRTRLWGRREKRVKLFFHPFARSHYPPLIRVEG